MIDIQNEIKYCAAWQIIRSLLLEGLLHAKNLMQPTKYWRGNSAHWLFGACNG